MPCCIWHHVVKTTRQPPAILFYFWFKKVSNHSLVTWSIVGDSFIVLEDVQLKDAVGQ